MKYSFLLVCFVLAIVSTGCGTPPGEPVRVGCWTVFNPHFVSEMDRCRPPAPPIYTRRGEESIRYGGYSWDHRYSEVETKDVSRGCCGEPIIDFHREKDDHVTESYRTPPRQPLEMIQVPYQQQQYSYPTPYSGSRGAIYAPYPYAR